MTAWAISRGTAAGTGGNGVIGVGPINVAMPAGYAAGDLILILLAGVFTTGSSASGWTVPGWTLVATTTTARQPATSTGTPASSMHPGQYALTTAVYQRTIQGGDPPNVAVTGGAAYANTLTVGGTTTYRSGWGAVAAKYHLTKTFALEPGGAATGTKVDWRALPNNVAEWVAPSIAVTNPCLVLSHTAGWPSTPSAPVYVQSFPVNLWSKLGDWRSFHHRFNQQVLNIGSTTIAGLSAPGLTASVQLADAIIDTAGVAPAPTYLSPSTAASSTPSAASAYDIAGITFAITNSDAHCERWGGVVSDIGVDPSNDMTLAVVNDLLHPITLTGTLQNYFIEFFDSTTGLQPVTAAEQRPDQRVLGDGANVPNTFDLRGIPYGSHIRYSIRRVDGAPIVGSATLRATDTLTGYSWDVLVTCAAGGIYYGKLVVGPAVGIL